MAFLLGVAWGVTLRLFLLLLPQCQQIIMLPSKTMYLKIPRRPLPTESMYMLYARKTFQGTRALVFRLMTLESLVL